VTGAAIVALALMAVALVVSAAKRQSACGKCPRCVSLHDHGEQRTGSSDAAAQIFAAVQYWQAECSQGACCLRTCTDPALTAATACCAAQQRRRPMRLIHTVISTWRCASLSRWVHMSMA